MILENDDNRHSLNRLHRRGGAILFELVVAGTLVAGMMTFILPILGRIAVARNDLACRESALRIVRNSGEELLAGTRRPEQIELPASAADRFEEATLTAERMTTDEGDRTGEAEPYRVRLAWRDGSQDGEREVALIVWIPTAGGAE